MLVWRMPLAASDVADAGTEASAADAVMDVDSVAGALTDASVADSVTDVPSEADAAAWAHAEKLNELKNIPMKARLLESCAALADDAVTAAVGDMDYQSSCRKRDREF